MDSHGDRFFSFWGALVTFIGFGLLAVVMAGIGAGVARKRAHPDDARRVTMDAETIATQNTLVNGWKQNEDGTYEVPIGVALPKLTGKFAEVQRSEVPVPGTKAAEEAAKAAAEAAAAATAAAAAGGEPAEGAPKEAPPDGTAQEPTAQPEGTKTPDDQ